MRRQHKAGLGFKLCLLIALAQAGARAVKADNINWGPFLMTAGLTTGFEYDDNVNTSQNNPQTDYFLLMGPFLNGTVTLPISLPGGQKASTQLGLAYTYKLSLTGRSQSTFTSPITASVLLPMYFQDWSVQLSDNFSFQNSPLETAAGFNRTTIPEYNNVALLSATRQFGRFSMTLAGQRTDNWAPQDIDLAETDYQVSITPAWYLRENVSIFLRNSYGLVYPDDPARQQVSFYSSEVGIAGVITPSLNGTVSIGFAHDHFDAVTLPGAGTGIFGGIFNPNVLPPSNLDGVISTLALNYTHPFRPNTTYSLSFYRTPGVTAVLKNSNATQSTGVNLNIVHKLSADLTLQPQVSWQHLEDVGAQLTGQPERADIILVGMQLSRAFGTKWFGVIQFNHQSRMSNLHDASYDDNKVDVTLSYTF